MQEADVSSTPCIYPQTPSFEKRNRRKSILIQLKWFDNNVCFLPRRKRRRRKLASWLRVIDWLNELIKWFVREWQDQSRPVSITVITAIPSSELWGRGLWPRYQATIPIVRPWRDTRWKGKKRQRISLWTRLPGFLCPRQTRQTFSRFVHRAPSRVRRSTYDPYSFDRYTTRGDR